MLIPQGRRRRHASATDMHTANAAAGEARNRGPAAAAHPWPLHAFVSLCRAVPLGAAPRWPTPNRSRPAPAAVDACALNKWPERPVAVVGHWAAAVGTNGGRRRGPRFILACCRTPALVDMPAGSGWVECGLAWRSLEAESGPVSIDRIARGSPWGPAGGAGASSSASDAPTARHVIIVLTTIILPIPHP